MSALVITGELRGKPWAVSPTFLRWYESWLERVEADLDDYKGVKLRNTS
jgi:hypothetical protein